MIKLSVLIPSLNSRAGMLASLLREFENQIKECNAKDTVDIVVEMDNGTMSIGEKRNILLGKAKGEYLVQVDDDDKISPDYLELILKGIETNPDCCSLNGFITFNGRGGKLFRHSIKYKSYYEEDSIYYRYPNHISVLRSSIAKQFRFPEINHGEDTDFATQIFNSGLLKIEYDIPTVIYFYDYKTNK